MTPEQIAIFDRLSDASQKFLLKVARRIGEGYEGEVTLHVIRGRNDSGQPRGSINFLRWSQVEKGDDLD